VRETARRAPPAHAALAHTPTALWLGAGRRVRGSTADDQRNNDLLTTSGLPGIFDGEHHLELHKRDGETTFIQREKFSGLLAPLFGRQLEKTKCGFEQMNAALKQYE
jgi:hypothetical protein